MFLYFLHKYHFPIWYIKTYAVQLVKYLKIINAIFFSFVGLIPPKTDLTFDVEDRKSVV